MDKVKPKNLFPCEICGEKFGRNQLKKHRKAKHPQPVPLILISKRGVRVNERMSCDSCQIHRDLFWRYSESNKGVVHICARCKPKLFDRSFNKIDALNFAKTGSSFETKRSKY
jgi:hypothetical protein